MQADRSRSRAQATSQIRDYALVAACVVLATLARFPLTPYLDNHAPFITYFPAIVAAAWIAGWSGGFLAIALSGLLATYLFIPPTHHLSIPASEDRVSLAIFIVVGIGISAISQAQRRSKLQLADAVAEAASLIRQAEERAECEALISRIGQALLSTLDPEVIQWRAACLLGEALGADRCFFVTYDFAADCICAGEDWHRPGLPSVMGEYPAAPYRFVLDELFARGTAVVCDAVKDLSADAAALQESFGQRATLAVPLYDKNELVAALFAAMADAPRVWTSSEVALIEEAAVLTRTALVSARLSQREQRIAARLQEALQPVIPAQVPGLRLAHFYRPALEEAEVGGDFADCFSVAEGQTILIVGDLSGKGLEAAAQVATIRNMLRFALYNGRTLSGPMTRLNRTLADNRLLVGFATLFAGLFDRSSRTLRYVNCGQDPALVLRAATGVVEHLAPTGAVLGAFSDVEYEEAALALEPGDIVAIFTDGLTEAGANRTQMLGMPGMTRLLCEQLGKDDPRMVVECIMAGVNAYARDGVRDDVCLLVAVVGDRADPDEAN